jgi:hypothetical protein
MRNIRIRFLLPAAAAVLSAIGLSGCASVNAESQRYIGAPQFAPTNPASVEILRREPRRPHVQLGEVILSPSGDPDVSDLEKGIREEAAKMGADAAVLVYDKTKRVGTVYSGPWWVRSATPIFGRKIVAVAIRYK